MTAYLTLKDSAKRVGRSTRTIEQWVADTELKVWWFHGKRYFEVGQLLEVYRAKLIANPNRPTSDDDE